ncbi:MAG: FxsA family protein, partial [Alphaproteobacteria bacterium]
MPLGLLLLILFIAVPLVEVALFIQIGGWIGLWPTLAAIVVTAVVGSAVIRHQGFGVAYRARKRMAAGEVPMREGFDGLCLVVAGLLMITPGFFTDAIGGALLLPPVRALVYGRVRDRIHVVMPEDARPGGRPPQPPGDVVDADYEVVDDDGGDEMPPPGQGWGPRE